MYFYSTSLYLLNSKKRRMKKKERKRNKVAEEKCFTRFKEIICCDTRMWELKDHANAWFLYYYYYPNKVITILISVTYTKDQNNQYAEHISK